MKNKKERAGALAVMVAAGTYLLLNPIFKTIDAIEWARDKAEHDEWRNKIW